ncbi:MAG: hypothetical protein KGL77_06115, partial [Actinomycetales bacterium]|nr:hypothetical protein [Actinomycetales bacterium]
MKPVFQKVAAFVTAAALSISLAGVSSASAAAPKARAGVACTAVNTKAKVSTTNLKCLKNSRGKLVWTTVTAAGKVIIRRASTASVATAPAVAATPSLEVAQRGPSGYEIIADPNNGGSSEVVYPD